MDQRLKTSLVDMTKKIINARDLEFLINFKSSNDGCGCLGPQGDDPLCPCAMHYALEEHLVEILNEIDPFAALDLLRARIIKALR